MVTTCSLTADLVTCNTWEYINNFTDTRTVLYFVYEKNESRLCCREPYYTLHVIRTHASLYMIDNPSLFSKNINLLTIAINRYIYCLLIVTTQRAGSDNVEMSSTMSFPFIWLNKMHRFPCLLPWQNKFIHTRAYIASTLNHSFSTSEWNRKYRDIASPS